MRIGIGYDIHPLVKSIPLVIGGVVIPFHSGLKGHSDGDSLTHAIIEALLGAMNSGNIGEYFPPDDPKYKNAASIGLLGTIRGELSKNKWRLVNLDATIIADRPPLASYLVPIRENIASVLDAELENISIKAKSNNGLGPIGQGKGIATLAVALIEGLPG